MRGKEGVDSKSSVLVLFPGGLIRHVRFKGRESKETERRLAQVGADG